MSFGTRLRELRISHCLTQKALAAVINVSPRMISFYESGEHFPRDEQILLQLASYFHVSTDYLLGYSDLRDIETLQKLNHDFLHLSISGQQSLIDYLDFLSQKHPRHST